MIRSLSTFISNQLQPLRVRSLHTGINLYRLSFTATLVARLEQRLMISSMMAQITLHFSNVQEISSSNLSAVAKIDCQSNHPIFQRILIISSLKRTYSRITFPIFFKCLLILLTSFLVTVIDYSIVETRPLRSSVPKRSSSICNMIETYDELCSAIMHSCLCDSNLVFPIIRKRMMLCIIINLIRFSIPR